MSLDRINDFLRTIAISSDHQVASSFCPSLTHTDQARFCFDTIQVNDVMHQLQSLDVSKAAGPDGISGLFLKAVASDIAIPLSTIYNKSIQTGSVPRAWKRSDVTPVYKGGDVNHPGNFRPISVVSIVAKVLEKMIANQLSSYMESRKLFHKHQGAYRRGKSSQQILMFAIDKIVNALDQHLVVCAAFLDLKKAFDSLDHVILLQRLEYMGVQGIELKEVY